MSIDDGFENRIIGNIKKNLSWILEKNYNNNQTLMAKELAIKPNTLYTYINTETKPSLSFICKLCSKINVSLDSFIYEDLELSDEKLKKKDVVKQLYNKYYDNYYVYFFVIDSNSLKEGLIQEGVLSVGDFGSINFDILNSGKQFSGRLITSDELIYFDLKNTKEKFNITLKSPGKNIKEKYHGGIGIMNLSSPEDSRIPCAQKVIISSTKIPIEEYYSTLRVFLSINTYFKIKKKLLYEILKNQLRISNIKYDFVKPFIEDNKISGEDKLIIGEDQFNILRNILDKEEYIKLKTLLTEPSYMKDIIPINSIKVSLEEDKMFYRFIKNEFNSSSY